jgi:hypothetical protein
MSQENNKKEKTVYFIEQEKFETEQDQLTVRHLLVDDAKEDPETTTLGTRHGNDITKYTDLDQLITIKNGMRFIIFHNEPTPVSKSE